MTLCLILAAGTGSRLKPLTDNTPKCLVEFLGKPILQYQLDVIEAVDIDSVAIVTGYRSSQIQMLGYKTFHNNLFDRTNMVESLFTARDYIKDSIGDVVISYGDIVYEKENLNAVLSCDADICVMVDCGWYDLWSIRNENPLDDAETLKLDHDGNILELGKKPKDLSEIEGQYTGLIKLSKNKVKEFISFYDSINRDQKYDQCSFNNMYMTTFLQLLIDSGWLVKAVKVKNGWLEIDTVNDLKLYEAMDEKGVLNNLWCPYG
ncbi:phosphocholine cytidylyltransferase family protein [Endozoicomonas lisbonensis]|uniref:Choline kinase n=1 Tax=Endozoicomonas lisbonensis TaxID=3120522 RepID=A0ABV2SML8_9GAMM